MRRIIVSFAISLALTAPAVHADPAGDDLADTVCIALSSPGFDDLAEAYVAGNDFDITDPELALSGLVFEEHGRKWYRWEKIQETSESELRNHIYGLCQVYGQQDAPTETTQPTLSFVLKAKRAMGPGTNLWFSYSKEP